MMTDIIYAGETAQFGQPEIKLGTIPGAGGSQRLSKAFGKSKAMHYILTGRNFNAQEALQHGLVAQVFPKEKLVEETVKIAAEIGSYSRLAVALAKEAVNASEELPLAQGVLYERKLFHSTFATVCLSSIY
jgi:enoyl-CoA hydratase